MKTYHPPPTSRNLPSSMRIRPGNPSVSSSGKEKIGPKYGGASFTHLRTNVKDLIFPSNSPPPPPLLYLNIIQGILPESRCPLFLIIQDFSPPHSPHFCISHFFPFPNFTFYIFTNSPYSPYSFLPFPLPFLPSPSLSPILPPPFPPHFPPMFSSI